MNQAARTFRAHPAALRQVRDFIREESVRGGLASVADDLVLAASEAAGNAIVHAEGDRIDVEWKLVDDSVEICVSDRGVFKRHVAVGIDEGGRGMFVMMSCVDEVSIQEGTPKEPGTVIRLRKRRPAGGGFGGSRYAQPALV